MFLVIKEIQEFIRDNVLDQALKTLIYLTLNYPEIQKN